jgi:hypothetical protein
MALAIILNQAAKPPGVAGFAREDLVTGVNVGLSLAGGPYISQLWSIIDKPVDLSVPAISNASIAAPTAAATVVQNIDRKGTHLIQVLVNQGFGLGARPEDIARITFFAGPAPLSATWNQLPRRVMAFLEKNEHNPQSDPVYGVVGNLRGWAQEWIRWFGVIERHDTEIASLQRAHAKVALPGGGPATFSGGLNIASVTRTGLGIVHVVFTTPLPTANYVVIPTAQGATGGSCVVLNELVGSFDIHRSDPFGAMADANFNFVVVGG